MNVYGIIPPDDKWVGMKAVYDSCMEMDIEVPEAVMEFFGDEPPDEKGVIVDLSDNGCAARFSEDMRNGVEIDIDTIPEHIVAIRFVMSY